MKDEHISNKRIISHSTYLNKGIGTHFHVSDKVFAVLCEFEDFDFILEDQIRESCFCKAYAQSQITSHVPFDTTWVAIEG